MSSDTTPPAVQTEPLDVLNRWTGRVQFTAHIPVGIVTKGLKLRAAVKWAIENKSNLRDSDLSGSDLSGSDLSGSDLSGSDLRDSNLSGSDLRDSNLSGSDLRGSDLSGSDLRGSDLRDSNLSGSDLRGSDLRGSDLRGSDLRGSDLSGSDLRDSNLSGSDLRDIKQDFLAEVLRLPNELEALRLALIEGRVDGSTYSGECACLAGTFANARGVTVRSGDTIGEGLTAFHVSADSPREMFFTAIRRGNKPETNVASAIALAWTDEAIAIRDMIRASAGAKS